MRRLAACFAPTLTAWFSLIFARSSGRNSPCFWSCSRRFASTRAIRRTSAGTASDDCPAKRTGLAAQGNTWKLLATLPGIIIHDISFPTAKIGYAVGELGQVWKTTDGGNSWVQQVLSERGSDYFYGVDAVTAKKVIISGFYDSSTAYGVFRWTEDGGNTWSSDMSPGPEWLQQVRFVKKQNGIMLTFGPRRRRS